MNEWMNDGREMVDEEWWMNDGWLNDDDDYWSVFMIWSFWCYYAKYDADDDCLYNYS